MTQPDTVLGWLETFGVDCITLAIDVKADGDLLLFDCGEGSQRQMIRFGTGFAVSAVFFTHFHADHYLGIIGFLRTLGMGGREEVLKLYGPAPARRLLDEAIHLGIEKLSFPVEVHELNARLPTHNVGWECCLRLLLRAVSSRWLQDRRACETR